MGKPRGLIVSEETKQKRKATRLKNGTDKKLSILYLGRKLTPNWIKNRTLAQKGLKRSVATRIKISIAKKGDKSHTWRGGISKINRTFRQNFNRTLEYKLWRETIFKRDNYTCIWCFKRGGVLNADHIKPFALFPELRLAIDNGRTLCVDCHKKTDTYGGKILKKLNDK